MKTFSEFLLELKTLDFSNALKVDSRPAIAVDKKLFGPGISLEKKTETNLLGQKAPSVVHLLRSLPTPCPELKGMAQKSPAELFTRFRIDPDDASPDSILGTIFLAAIATGIEVPAGVWHQWEPVITSWEVASVAENPEISWPALASALAHTIMDSIEGNVATPELIARAWPSTMQFAIEALQNDWDPANIEATAQGPLLAQARAALDEEVARYERKVYAQQFHQLSLPMIGSTRRRLVDALFTAEHEFSGALKITARNDHKHAPLGRGFTLLAIERPTLRDVQPSGWLTISLDARANLHLRDLWYELERLETRKWQQLGRTRPLRDDPKLPLQNIPEADQKFREHWYIDPAHSLVASPNPQTDPSEGSSAGDGAPGSLLSVEEVRDAIFRTYEPHLQCPVKVSDTAPEIPLSEVPAKVTAGGKYLLQAQWASGEPLPHPSGPTPYFGLFPTALKTMAAKTLGVQPDQVMEIAPDIEDFEVIAFGNSIATISDGGVFLLDSGRRRPPNIHRAVTLVEALAQVAAELDAIQKEIGERSWTQTEELSQRRPLRAWVDHQQFCTDCDAQLIRLRTALDKPLTTSQAGLAPLRRALSEKWNIRQRLQELGSEVASLQQNGRAAEELRMFRVGRWAAGIGLSIVIAEALSDRLISVISPPPANAPGQSDLLAAAPWAELALFGGLFCAVLLALHLGESLLRGTAKPRGR